MVIGFIGAGLFSGWLSFFQLFTGVSINGFATSPPAFARFLPGYLHMLIGKAPLAFCGKNGTMPRCPIPLLQAYAAGSEKACKHKPLFPKIYLFETQELPFHNCPAAR